MTTRRSTSDRSGYADWLRYVFDHPVEEPQWYSSPDAYCWEDEAAPSTALAYLTRLFLRPRVLVGRYTPEQIGQGLWFLFGGMSDVYVKGLRNPDLPLARRIRCVRALESLYRDLLTPLCRPAPEGPDTVEDREPDLFCHMLWDIGFRFWDWEPEHERAIDLACLEVMRRALAMKHSACQCSALHGLGHFHERYPAEVKRIIDAWLARQEPPKALAAYARQARRGKVL